MLKSLIPNMDLFGKHAQAAAGHINLIGSGNLKTLNEKLNYFKTTLSNASNHS
jgi:hypothetical protein